MQNELSSEHCEDSTQLGGSGTVQEDVFYTYLNMYIYRERERESVEERLSRHPPLPEAAGGSLNCLSVQPCSQLLDLCKDKLVPLSLPTICLPA